MAERPMKPQGPLTQLWSSGRVRQWGPILTAVSLLYVASMGPVSALAIRVSCRPGRPHLSWPEPAVSAIYAPLGPLIDLTSSHRLAGEYVEWCYSLSMRWAPPSAAAMNPPPSGYRD